MVLGRLSRVNLLKFEVEGVLGRIENAAMRSNRVDTAVND